MRLNSKCFSLLLWHRMIIQEVPVLQKYLVTSVLVYITSTPREIVDKQTKMVDTVNYIVRSRYMTKVQPNKTTT